MEPYVVAADVYAVAPHTGRGGWTWYTGSAGWMYRLILESLLGLRREGSQLRVEPCTPAYWSGFKVHYRYGETVYHILVLRNSTIINDALVTVDGVARHRPDRNGPRLRYHTEKENRTMQRLAAKLVIGMAITAIGMFGADSSLGTWKWNAAKSKSISTNPLKSRTDLYEATPDGGVNVTRSDVRADGTTRNFNYTFKYDGKEYPVTGATFDTISAKRVDANTTVTVVKKTGSAHIETSQTVYSKDGKTRTQTVKGISSAGKLVDSTFVFDKQ